MLPDEECPIGMLALPHNHVKSSKAAPKDGKVVAVKNMDKHVKNQAPGAGKEKAEENARMAVRIRH